MANRNPKNFDHLPAGFLFAEQCTAANLEPVGSTSTSSTYTEDGSRPGYPVADDEFSRLRLELSNAQGVDSTWEVFKGGNPSRRSCGLLWRDDPSGGSNQFRNYNYPTAHMGWKPVSWEDASERNDVVTVPSTQRVVMVHKETGAVPQNALTRIIEQDRTITNGDTVTAVADSGDWQHPALAILPGSERILLMYSGKMLYSDDQGVTFLLYSLAPVLEPFTNFERTRMAVYRGDIIMMVSDSTTDTMHQYVSTDAGASFQLLKTYTTFGWQPDVFANEDGVHVVYAVGTGTEKINYRRLGSIFEELDAVAATELASGGTYMEPTIVGDGGGTLYVNYCSELVLGSQIVQSVSVDAGATWDDTPLIGGFSMQARPNTNRYSYLSAAWSQGQIMLGHGYQESGVEVADRLGVAFLGQWSQTSFVTSGRDSFAGFGVGSLFGYTFHPFSLPSAQGWTLTGAGTEAISAAGGYLTLTTAAQTAFYSHTLSGGGNPFDIVGSFEIQVTAGGTTTGLDVGLLLRVADGTDDVEVELRFKTDTLTIVDTFSGTAVQHSIDFSTDFKRVSFVLKRTNPGVLRIAVGDPGSTLDVDLSLSRGLTFNTSSPAANGVIEWGNIASATATSRWRYVNFRATGADTEDMSYVGLVGPSLDSSENRGKPLNARPEPIPALGDADPLAAGANVFSSYVAAVAGPARRDEQISVPLFHDFAIENCHSEIHASPRVLWRSTSTAQQVIVYDLGDETWTGHGVGLFVANANFKTIHLERWDGAMWVTEATLNLADGFEGLTYIRNGDMIYPNIATTTDADRWLWEQELAPRGWVLGNLGPTESTRIKSQSSGGWTQGSTVVPMLELEDASVLFSSTQVDLVSTTGLVVTYKSNINNTMSRYWRARIPVGVAGRDTPDLEDFYEAGVISVCRLQLFGAHTEWGKVNRTERNAEDTSDTFGTLRTRQLGPLRKSATFGWPNAEHHRQLRIGPDVDFWAPSGKLGNVGAEDVSEIIRGLIKRLESGETPVIYVDPMPDQDGEIITDPTRFVYGRVTTGVSTSEASGVMGTDEDLRVETITVDEIV